VASLLLSSGEAGGKSAGLPRGSEVVVGILADPVSLDPHRATDIVSGAIVSNVCETLVRLRREGTRPEASLATTWATIDSRVWTFTLRDGVRFHDGAPFDADAVVANLESLRRVRGFPGQAERVGPLVVGISLDRPNAALLATLSQPFFCLQSPRELLRPRPQLVGTGPFKVEHVRPGLVELASNHDYWGGAPRLERVTFRRVADEDTLVSNLLSGDIDVTSSLGQGGTDRLRQSEIAIDSKAGLNIAFLSLNNEKQPLSDPRVRRALARAVDRDAIVGRVLAGHGVPANNPLPPSLWAHGTRTKELRLDRPAARRLLAEAGFAQGFEISLMVVDSPRPYMPSPLALASQIREDLQQVGVRIRLVTAPSWKEYVDRGSRGEYEMAVLGWQADTPDPNDFLSALLASESVGTTNRSRYRSAEMDALLSRGRRSGDAEQRAGIYREAQEVFQKDMPWVPLYHVPVFMAYRRALHGVTVSPTGILRYEKAWKVL